MSLADGVELDNKSEETKSEEVKEDTSNGTEPQPDWFHMEGY